MVPAETARVFVYKFIQEPCSGQAWDGFVNKCSFSCCVCGVIGLGLSLISKCCLPVVRWGTIYYRQILHLLKPTHML